MRRFWLGATVTKADVNILERGPVGARLPALHGPKRRASLCAHPERLRFVRPPACLSRVLLSFSLVLVMWWEAGVSLWLYLAFP